MDFETLAADLRHRLCETYTQTFSDLDVAALKRIYKPDAVVTFHLLQDAKTVSIHTGGFLAMLIRGRVPIALAAKGLARRLARQGYDHSVMRLLAVEDTTTAGGARARAHCRIERFNTEGERYETSTPWSASTAPGASPSGGSTAPTGRPPSTWAWRGSRPSDRLPGATSPAHRPANPSI